jgi:hypothetical protein
MQQGCDMENQTIFSGSGWIGAGAVKSPPFPAAGIFFYGFRCPRAA